MFSKKTGEEMLCRSKFCPRRSPKCWRTNTAGRLRLRKAMSMAKYGADGTEYCLSLHRSELTSIRWGSGRLTSIGRAGADGNFEDSKPRPTHYKMLSLS